MSGFTGLVGPNEGPPGPHTVIEDTGTPFDGQPCDCHELTGDGVDDLSMKFNTDEVVAALMLDSFNEHCFFLIDRLGNFSHELLLWMSSEFCTDDVRNRLV